MVGALEIASFLRVPFAECSTLSIAENISDLALPFSDCVGSGVIDDEGNYSEMLGLPWDHWP